MMLAATVTLAGIRVVDAQGYKADLDYKCIKQGRLLHSFGNIHDTASEPDVNLYVILIIMVQNTIKGCCEL